MVCLSRLDVACGLLLERWWCGWNEDLRICVECGLRERARGVASF